MTACMMFVFMCSIPKTEIRAVPLLVWLLSPHISHAAPQPRWGTTRYIIIIPLESDVYFTGTLFHIYACSYDSPMELLVDNCASGWRYHLDEIMRVGSGRVPRDRGLGIGVLLAHFVQPLHVRLIMLVIASFSTEELANTKRCIGGGGCIFFVTKLSRGGWSLIGLA